MIGPPSGLWVSPSGMGICGWGVWPWVGLGGLCSGVTGGPPLSRGCCLCDLLLVLTWVSLWLSGLSLLGPPGALRVLGGQECYWINPLAIVVTMYFGHSLGYHSKFYGKFAL